MKRAIITLPGADVRTASLDEKVLDSLYPNPKIDVRARPQHAGIINVNWSSDNITVPLGTTKEIYSFQHNYGYIPTAFASYAYNYDTPSPINGTLPFQYGSLGMIIVDADLLYIRLRWLSMDPGIPLNAITPFTMRVRFYVMAERGYDT